MSAMTIDATERLTSFGIPFLARQEVLRVVENKIDHTGIQDDRLHGALMLRAHELPVIAEYTLV